ncbi:MAG: phosphoribosylglycinamide formyltransferase [Candidatus Omnitrophica bacterium]|nr:phosphoribosylglycinamide formyltransferase [Candidatus Omnitrophota bacterium]MBU1923342.1 phosphoribosylglycinamide formyltransferase [Candidatus Omnitrophota bacterium]
MNLAIFASGNGSNFSAIVEAIKQSKVKVKLVILVCDKPEAFVIKRAQKAKVQVILARREDFANRLDFERAIIHRLKSYSIDLIALAGFMRILSPTFVKQYRKRILNIHPSLLPAFKGAHAIKDALDYKASFTGVTVHFVDEKMDHGPVILQKQVKIRSSDTLASLEKRIHDLEHRLYPQAIKLFLAEKIKSRVKKVSVSTL